ncbi:MAG: hypothetical protein WA705_27665 [Candidatus Ozemobacteraceae bacterium]
MTHALMHARKPVRGRWIGLVAAILTLLLFFGGFLQGLDEYLLTCIFQIGYAEQRPCPEIFLVRKDEQTSAFL